MQVIRFYYVSGTSCTLFGTSAAPASPMVSFAEPTSPETLEDIATGKETLGSSIFEVEQK